MPGEATIEGAALPVRAMLLGLLAASLSMTRVPASLLGCCEGEPRAT